MKLNLSGLVSSSTAAGKWMLMSDCGGVSPHQSCHRSAWQLVQRFRLENVSFNRTPSVKPPLREECQSCTRDRNWNSFQPLAFCPVSEDAGVSGSLIDSHWISGLLSRRNVASQVWWRLWGKHESRGERASTSGSADIFKALLSKQFNAVLWHWRIQSQGLNISFSSKESSLRRQTTVY